MSPTCRLLPFAAVLLVACGDAPLPTGGTPPAVTQSTRLLDDGHLAVFVQNLYIGTDVDAVLTAPPDQVAGKVIEALATFVATDWADRAAAIAAAIVAAQADVVALNEVTTLEVAGFAPFFPDFTVPFLDVLMAAISQAGGEYDLAGVVDNIDLTLALGGASIRLRDADAMLVRRGVGVTNVTAANYAARVTVPLGPLGAVDLVRGYVAADITSNGRTARVAVTHLEPKSTSPLLQLGQAQELAAALGQTTLPVIIAGDINSDPADPDPVTPYRLFTAAGFQDAGLLANGQGGNVPTCCHDPDLRNAIQAFDERIDHVLMRRTAESHQPDKPIRPVRFDLFGDAPAERTAGGLWPSDHAGVIVRIGWQGLLY